MSLLTLINQLNMKCRVRYATVLMNAIYILYNRRKNLSHEKQLFVYIFSASFVYHAVLLIDTRGDQALIGKHVLYCHYITLITALKSLLGRTAWVSPAN